LLGHFQNSLAITLRVGAELADDGFFSWIFHRVFLKPETLSGNLIA
jgi:hypothetical protein